MSRLRPRNTNMEYGYISRADGDQQLQHVAIQEVFFHQLREQYQLKPLLVDVSITNNSTNDGNSSHFKQSDKVVSQCLSSLRKLREGIISSDRQDEFAVEVFESTVRYAILHEHVESYFPAMQYLHNTLYLCKDLKDKEDLLSRRRMMSGLLALHLCSINEYREAIEISNCSKITSDKLVNELIRALIHSNWHKWQALGRRANSLQSKILTTISLEVSQRTLATISTAYMTVDVSWLWKFCGQISEDNLLERGWIVNNSKVQFRLPKGAKK